MKRLLIRKAIVSSLRLPPLSHNPPLSACPQYLVCLASLDPFNVEIRQEVILFALQSNLVDTSQLYLGSSSNPRYQEASQVPEAGSTQINNVPNVVGGKNAHKDGKPLGHSNSASSLTNESVKKPDLEVGEAVSAIKPSVKVCDFSAATIFSNSRAIPACTVYLIVLHNAGEEQRPLDPS